MYPKINVVSYKLKKKKIKNYSTVILALTPYAVLQYS